MEDKSKKIYGNDIDRRAYRKAVNSKKRFVKKYGDDSRKNYPVTVNKNKYIGDALGVYDVRVGDKSEVKETEKFDTKSGIIVGNIKMGFGHYRISMAIASAANAMGYVPYWMDLNSYEDTTCTKVIKAQNDLYSLGSRLSQKSRLFNHFVWEPMNYEGFRKLSYNASDQKNAELMAPVYKNVPKEIPVVATHVWPAQAAVHAEMKYVVNAIPDNWPMALHLSEGSIHTVQTHFAYQGYRILNGMNGKKVLNPMPSESLIYTGHYIDHELVAGIETDCKARRERKKNKKPMRFLLTIGGAGAQKEIFAHIIRYLLPYVKSENIFEAVYCTNLLMRSADVLVTKPSELAFYPVPKLFIRRVGGHEQWGAIHSAEIGDGTLECRDIPHTLQMIKLFMNDDKLLCDMCDNIEANKKAGIYNGAYEAVKIAMNMKKE